jgi:bifunctional DNA-binding transcriptional regulator/antitoxin component of YhaV-PrlF toxin-antitoxin module
LIDPKDLKGRGLTLYLTVQTSKFSNKEAAERAGFKENTFYTHIKKEDLSYAILAKYGKAINHDFSIDFPEMDEYFPENLNNNTKTPSDKEHNQLKDKYTKLLEAHKDLQERYNDLQVKYFELLNKKIK